MALSKEKLVSLQKYASDLKNRISSPVTEKHKEHPVTYKQFLERELQAVTKTLEAAKLDAPTAGPKK